MRLIKFRYSRHWKAQFIANFMNVIWFQKASQRNDFVAWFVLKTFEIFLWGKIVSLALGENTSKDVTAPLAASFKRSNVTTKQQGLVTEATRCRLRCKDFVNSWLLIVYTIYLSQSRDGVFSPPPQYWYQGCFLTHLSWIPASVLILIEAASAAVTVCLTDCIRFWALPTSISVASMSSSVPKIKEHDAIHCYSREGINWAKPLGACSSYNIAKIPINLDAKWKLLFSSFQKCSWMLILA